MLIDLNGFVLPQLGNLFFYTMLNLLKLGPSFYLFTNPIIGVAAKGHCWQLYWRHIARKLSRATIHSDIAFFHRQKTLKHGYVSHHDYK